MKLEAHTEVTFKPGRKLVDVTKLHVQLFPLAQLKLLYFAHKILPSNNNNKNPSILLKVVVKL